MSPPNDVELISVEAVAKIIGGDKPVNVATVFRRARKGQIPQPVRLSQRLIRWNKAELMEWLSRKAA
jgi:predicted DNA-binding transcriptional regulator AlpA